ncbi:60S acidic ribosomal protein P0 [Plecturocebus cupreus]
MHWWMDFFISSGRDVIQRGTIKILSDVQLIRTEDSVEASEATLLNMLITAHLFSFGLIIEQLFDNGSIYNA